MSNNRRKGFVFFIAALLSCVAPPAVAAAWEENTNRDGDEYSRYVVPDGRWETCATPCADDVRCMAFTFYKPTPTQAAMCSLKSNTGLPIGWNCCSSGTIVRDANGRAIPDIGNARFVLYDGENSYGILTFTSGAPGTAVSGTLQVDNLTRGFTGTYTEQGVLDLNVQGESGNVYFHLGVDRVSGTSGPMRFVRTSVTGTGTIVGPDGTEEGNMSGTCDRNCPY